MTTGDGEPPQDPISRLLVVPADEGERKRHRAAFAEFCSVFPDAFYISERGRDYLGKPRSEQEKGRLLSAGFHSMMGYFRDDGPLYDLILDERQRSELDGLWQELDFVSSAPMRQYSGFLWFERTDSGFMRDPQFDFARPEDKSATSAKMIKRLSKVYLEKVADRGGSELAQQAVRDYFRGIDAQIRWVESARQKAEPSHLAAVLDFATRAFRRELSSTEQHDLREFYRTLREDDELSHEEAIQDTLVSILMSPHFCYRLDHASGGSGTRPLSNYELASRLSFFLWSSVPDAALLKQVAAGNLQEPDVLRAQLQRMLQDARVRRWALEFGGHWLEFRRFDSHNSVDRQRFPQFTDELRAAMQEEPIRFLVDAIQNDRSVLECLYGQHTFVNRPLARHYGIEDLEFGTVDEWQRIDNAPQYARGGLLPMAVFLTANSPGLRTSPVKRGYWIARRLLGEQIPPPPPDVPEIPDDETALGDLTVREVLARHRAHTSCAGCHVRFDSFGVVFEGYGPVGERRKVDLGGRPVETQAEFPNGDKGRGLTGLRRHLREHREAEFVDNLCRKLLAYALGRTLVLSDELLIEKMKDELVRADYRFSALFATVVTSPQFLQKRGRIDVLEK